MALNVATLVARVLADTSQFQRGMDAVEGRVATAGQTMMRTGGVMTRGLTIPLLATAAASVKFSVDFERQMEFIHTQAGKSQAEVDRMTKSVLALAPATAQGPVELAKALYHIESVGATGARAMNLLKVASQGAAVGNANLEDTASALAGTMRVYHLAARDAAGMMGDLNAVVGAGNMRMEDMVNAIQTGLFPTAKGLGMTFREVGSALATMTDESVPAQVAATRMCTLFLLMSGETKKSADTLKTLGIGQLDLAHAMMRPGGMINALIILRDHLNKFTSDPALQTQFLAKAFGGARSSGTIIQLLNNLGMVQNKLHQINQTAGNFPQAVLATQETSAFKLHQAWSQLETSLIHIGQVVTPIFVSIAQAVAHLVSGFSSLSPNTQRFLVEMGLIVAVVGPAIFLFGALTTGIAALMSPVGLTVLALTAMVAVAQKLGDLRALAGILAGAAVAFGIFAVAATAAGAAETAVIRGMYALEAVMATNPFGVLAIALGALTGFLIATGQGADKDAAAFHNAASALDAYVNAINRAKGTSLQLKDAQLAVQSAHVNVQRAVQNLQQVEQRAGHTHLDVKEAALGVRAAYLELAHAHSNLQTASTKSERAQKKVQQTSDDQSAALEGLRKHFDTLTQKIDHSSRAGQEFGRGASVMLRSLKVSEVQKFTQQMDQLALKAQRVAQANQDSNPKIAAAASKMRDQALATANLARKLHEVPDAVSKSKGAAQAEANLLGLAITAGVVGGVGGLGRQLGGVIASEISAGIAAGKRAAGAHSPSTVTRDQIGKPLGQGVVLGYILGSRDLPDKIKDSIRKSLEAARQEVQNQQEKVRNAFQRLADYAMRAYDARTEQIVNERKAKLDADIMRLVTEPLAAAEKELDRQHQAALDAIEASRAALTPAEQELRDLQTAHDEAQRQESIAAAQAALRQAQQIGDPGQILAAQKALDEALYAEHIAQLQKQAEAERATKDAQAKIQEQSENERYDAQRKFLEDTFAAIQKGLEDQFAEWEKNYRSERELRKQHLQDMLDAMEKDLEKHPEHWKKWHARIMKLFKDAFGPDYQTAGHNLGTGFAKGLRESFGDVKKALHELADIIERILKLHSPAREGPMADLDTWWSGFSETLLSSLDTAAVEQAATNLGRVMRQRISYDTPSLSPSAGTGATAPTGGDTYVFQIEGSVIHEDKLLDLLQKKALQKKARSGSLGIG